MGKPRRTPRNTNAPDVTPDATPTTTSDRLLDLAEVQERTGKFSRQTIWRMSKDGAFPRPIPVGPRRFWSEREIDQWIADRKADRDVVTR